MPLLRKGLPAAALLALAGCADRAEGPVLAAPTGLPAAVVAGSDRTNLGTLGGATSAAYDINGGGVVVGTSLDSGGATRAFRWTSGGGMTALPTGTTHGRAINEGGQVAGRGVFGTAVRGFIWTPGPGSGTLKQLPVGLPGASAGDAYDVNAAGQAVGFVLVTGKPRAVLWTPDVTAPGGYRTTALGDFGGGEGQALGISADGTVVGWATQAAGTHRAFRWTPNAPNGTTGTLARLPEAGGSSSEAHDINDAGQVAGWVVDDGGRRTVRWDPGEVDPTFLGTQTYPFGEPRAISADGNRLAGVHNSRATAFAPQSDGLPLSAPAGVSSADGISPNGAFIVGAAGGTAALWTNVVTNGPPVAAIVGGSPKYVPVGQTIVLDATASTDPDGDPLTYFWLSANREDTMAVGPTFSFSGASVRRSQFYVVAKDDDGRADSTLFVVFVNTPPVAVIEGSDTVAVEEGEVFRMEGDASYDPDGNVIKFLWNMGDGTTYTTPGVNKRYADDGTYDVRLIVTDSTRETPLNRADTAYATVIVTNVAPTATFPGGAAQEGTVRTLSLINPVDPGSADTASLEYAFDCGSGFGGFGPSPTTTCPAVPDQDTVEVGARIRDDDGGVSTYTRSQYVANVLPIVNGGASDTSVQVGELVTVVGSFTDPGADAPWTWSYDWGDGVTTRGGTSSTTLPPSAHRYTAPGTYNLLITVRDDRGVGKAAPVTITVTP